LSHDTDEQPDDLATLDAPMLDSADDLPKVFDNWATEICAWRRSRRRRANTGPSGVQGLLLPSPFVTVTVFGAATVGFLPCVVVPATKRTADIAAPTVARVGKDQDAAAGAPDHPTPQVRTQA
jgi:hypothetical protein